jgi:hypothetical protein
MALLNFMDQVKVFTPIFSILFMLELEGASLLPVSLAALDHS